MSLKTNKNNKNKKKSGLASTEGEVALEVANAEVKTLKTKIKEQESSLKDLKFQNSVLLERIASLEKTQKQSIYSSCFPSIETPSPQTHYCVHQLHSCHCLPLCQSCHPKKSCFSSISQSLSDISEKIDGILRNCVSSNVHVPPPTLQETISDMKESRNCTAATGHHSLQQSVVDVLDKTTDSDSFISIDNFMPNPEEKLCLNSEALTSRPTQPMLLNPKTS